MADEIVPDVCQVTPVEAYMSTNLNNKVKSYNDLMLRILNRLGYPAISITELHRDIIYDAISIACEFYTKYAGFTKEELTFDSNIYDYRKGLRLDQLYTIAMTEQAHEKELANVALYKTSIDNTHQVDKDVYVTLKEIPVVDYTVSDKDAEILMENCRKEQKELICLLQDMKKHYPDGIEAYVPIDYILYDYLINNVKRGDGSPKYTKDDFKKSKNKRITCAGEEVENVYEENEKLGEIRKDIHYQNSFDYDLMDYRRVKSVIDYQEGSSNTMTSLFSFESSLAASAYLTYQFSLRGFDMSTFYCMHEWREMRQKILTTERDFWFDNKTQYFRLSPAPKPNQRYFGIITCYVERPLREVINEHWVFRYALALCKETAGRIRSRWGDSTQLPGGGVITGNVLLQEGLTEKKELEQLLIKEKGFGDWNCPMFYVG